VASSIDEQTDQADQVSQPSGIAGSDAALERFLARLQPLRVWLASNEAAITGLAVAGLALEFALLRWWLPALSFRGHPGFMAPGQDPLVWLLGDGDTGMVRLLQLFAAAFVPYFLGLAIAPRVSGRIGIAVAFAGAVIAGLTMLAMFPAGALDIFHNIMDGRLVWLYHINPTLYPPSVVSNDPLFQYMHYWADTRTAYGPLWFIATLPAYLIAGSDLTRSMIAYKALPFAFEIASLVLIAVIARRIDPRKTVAAIVCFGWNPLVLWEIPGNGHNDIVMMAFVLGAVLVLLSDNWPWAFVLLACSVMVKYVSLVVLPVFILWIYLRYGRRSLSSIASGLLGGLVAAMVIALPFWSGPRTFAPLFGQEQDFLFSPASALIREWGENIALTPLVVNVKRALTLAFALLYALVLTRVRRSPSALIRSCVEVVFLLLVLLTWWFWPWYVVWGLALAALIPTSAHARLFVIFSVSAMFIYLSSPWRLSIWYFGSFFPLALGTALIVFVPPFLYALMHLLDAIPMAGGDGGLESSLPS
jgi:alpha-1,6-mannosyltransferase